MRIAATILILLATLCARGATITAANTTIGAVSNALFLCAASGDILSIPNGNASWTNGLYVSNHVAIVGQSRSGVVISNAIPDSEDVSRRHAFLFDLMFHSRTSYLGNLTITEDPSQRAAGPATGFFSHHIQVEGNNADGRRLGITNCTLIKTNGVSLNVESALGVIYGCQLNLSNTAIGIYGYHRNWNGGTLGHGAWATNDNFGTDQFWFVENCGLARDFAFTTLDGYAGWRYVFRHNNGTNISTEGHGPELTAGRGTRASETYSNRWWWTSLSQVATFQRSGVQLICSNECRSDGSFIGTQPFKLVYYRHFEETSSWMGANGTNAFDLNQAGGPFGSGAVVSTNSNGPFVLSVSVSGTPWSENQWRGYSIIRTNDGGGYGEVSYSLVISNSPNTLYYALAQHPPLRWAVGDKFQFWKVNVALDQHGRGKGSLLTDLIPFVSGNDQELSTCYEWANTNLTDNTDMDFGPSMVTDVVYANGRDYTNNAAKPGWTPFLYPHGIVTATAGSGGGPDATAKAAVGLRSVRMR